jgi:SAM-dependent methyltransferase
MRDQMGKSYGDSGVWDRRFGVDGDLDWGGLWTDPFIGLLRDNGSRKLLDLGCGTGNDVVRLATAGFSVTGLDFSNKAIDLASAKEIPGAEFVQADMTETLPFPQAYFDAVFSNVALHMFDDSTTARIVAEVRRILISGGTFIFHVNSHEDRELRSSRKRVVKVLARNLVQEEDGQTMHYFSADELRDLFTRWTTLRLEHLEIPHQKTGEPFKRVWRGIATK